VKVEKETFACGVSCAGFPFKRRSIDKHACINDFIHLHLIPLIPGEDISRIGEVAADGRGGAIIVGPIRRGGGGGIDALLTALVGSSGQSDARVEDHSCQERQRDGEASASRLRCHHAAFLS